MTSEPLAELYFKWLYRQVAPVRLKNPARTYWSLLRQLHNKEFVWFVPNDDNRVVDGMELRQEFFQAIGGTPSGHPDITDRGCTMLEMLLALSRRLSFSGGGASSDWFWHMLDNLGLRVCNDAEPWTQASHAYVDEVLTRVIERTYQSDGTGGLFPLKEARVDQRQVEIWYQMNNYLIERG